MFRGKIPSAPTDPPSPATIVGIRMVTADRERALRQWSEVLQGEEDDRGDELIHRANLVLQA